MKTRGNTILITGGTSGIGLGFAEKFHRLGNKVIICGRRKDRLERIRKTHKGIATIVCDLQNAAQRTRLRNRVVREFPDMNILLNNAGIQLCVDFMDPVDLEMVRSEIEINLVAPLHLGSLFAEHLSMKKPSAVINVTSGLAFTPIASVPIYCATKAAVHSLTMSLRHQFRKTPVKVFEIIPPSVDTELGHEHRVDKTESHGGMPVSKFVDEAVRAIEKNLFEAPIGPAAGLHKKREALFSVINR